MAGVSPARFWLLALHAGLIVTSLHVGGGGGEQTAELSSASASGCGEKADKTLKSLCAIAKRIKGWRPIKESFKTGAREVKGTLYSRMEDMFKALGSGTVKCDWLDGYATDGGLTKKANQCTSNDSEYRILYTPGRGMREQIIAFLGYGDSMNLFGVDPRLGEKKWCGMPAPAAKGFRNVGTPEVRGAPVQRYWASCVKNIAGYMNALICTEQDVYAVIGMAAFGPGLCYPAHVHWNEEAYWEISGQGAVLAWDKLGNRTAALIGAIQHVEGRPRVEYHFMAHQAGVPHEMVVPSTSPGLLTCYWWAAQEKGGQLDIQYQYAYMFEKTSCVSDVPATFFLGSTKSAESGSAAVVRRSCISNPEAKSGIGGRTLTSLRSNRRSIPVDVSLGGGGIGGWNGCLPKLKQLDSCISASGKLHEHSGPICAGFRATPVGERIARSSSSGHTELERELGESSQVGCTFRLMDSVGFGVEPHEPVEHMSEPVGLPSDGAEAHE